VKDKAEKLTQKELLRKFNEYAYLSIEQAENSGDP
jgi:hypothetical protein